MSQVDPEILEVFQQDAEKDGAKDNPIQFSWDEVGSSSYENAGYINFFGVEGSGGRPFELSWSEVIPIFRLLKDGYADVRIGQIRKVAVKKVAEIRAFVEKKLGITLIQKHGLQILPPEDDSNTEEKAHRVPPGEKPQCFSNLRVKTRLVYIDRPVFFYKNKIITKRERIVIEKPVYKNRIIEKVKVYCPSPKLPNQPKTGKRAFKRAAIKELLEQGHCDREICRKIAVHSGTVSKIRKELEEINGKPFLCACGEPSNHRGWCKARYKKSGKRQDFIRSMKGHSWSKKLKSNTIRCCEICAKKLHFTTKTSRCRKHVNHTKALNAKKWRVIRPDKAEYIIKNLLEFCRSNNLDYNSMISCADNKWNHCTSDGWSVERL